MRVHSTVLAMLVLASASTNNPAAASQSVLPGNVMARIDRLFTEALRSRALPGASVTIAYDDGSILSKSYGVASLAKGAPVTRHTRFRIGSISKTFTALAVMKLVEDGRLELDEPISSILTDEELVRRLPRSVTVRHLLNHTSGLPDYTPAEIDAKVAAGFVNDADLLAVLTRARSSDPGINWSYSDAAYRLLSFVVGQSSGLPYERYVAEHLAPALGLQSLRFCGPDDPQQASGYVSREGELRPERAYEIQGLLGEGGLCATADDLAILPARLKSNQWISEASLRQMLAPTRLKGGEEIAYGFGIRKGLFGQTRPWGHTGGGPDGSWAAMAHYPEKKVTVAVMANGTGSGTDAATLQGSIAAVLLGLSPPRDQGVEPSAAQLLPGAYSRGESTSCITVKSGKLVRRRGSSAPTPLLHLGSLVFARADYPLDRIEFQTENGRVLGYRVYYDGLFAEYWRRAGSDACS